MQYNESEVKCSVAGRDSDSSHKSHFEAAALMNHDYPSNRFAGRGIVICGGGLRYFACAYICLRALRHVGCNLPVELWHLGSNEMSADMRRIAETLGAVTVDAQVVRETFPVRTLGGWELKCYSLLHCAFEEVLLLDADNIPIVDPTYLFTTPEYLKFGAIFWPDFERLGPERAIWELTGIPYRDEPEFESGQIVVNKRTCWNCLNLSMFLNEYSDFYYNHIHGDKETFHMAWRKLKQDYAMPDRGIDAIPFTMCQHDFSGNRVFQHRNMDKWRVFGGNHRITDFLLESECFTWLEELRLQWNPLPEGCHRYDSTQKMGSEIACAAELTAMSYDYHRIQHDRRVLEFGSDGKVQTGARACELTWDVNFVDGLVQISIYGEYGLTVTLTRGLDGIWRGRWLQFECMEVELTPLRLKSVEHGRTTLAY